MVPKWLRVAGLCAVLAASAAAASRVEEWAVVLKAPPVASRVTARAALKGAEALAGRQAIARAQRAVRAELQSRGLRVTGSAQVLVNAIFVRATPEQARQLRLLPGVARVAWLPPVRMLMDRAAKLVRAPAAWDALGGQQNAGLGIKIAVIDSGIDDKHPAFHDDTLTAPENPPASPPENAEYTSNKVLVARSYVDRLPNQPDDTSPLDHVGHGTAVAAAAAGESVTTPVATISGIAPKAYIGNYKIFGSPGVNDTSTGSVVIAALEDALNDGMDIAVLAVGAQPLYPPLAEDAACAADSSPGLDMPADSCDVLAQAAEHAVARGMTVVVAAGDDANLSAYWWPTYTTITSPGTAPSVITVGASENAYSSVRVGGDAVPQGLDAVGALFGDGPKPADPLTASVKDAAPLVTDGLGCEPFPAGSLEGSIALILRGTCDFATKVANAQDAGAVGVILYNSDGNDWSFNPFGLADTKIPAVMIGNADGVALAGRIAEVPDSPVTIDPTYPGPGEATEEIASFSSRGPALGSDPGDATRPMPTIKPDLVAPGADLYTASQSLDPNGWYWDPSGYTYAEGSSFAAGVVAGAAALVKQQNPGFGPSQIKSALVNSAAQEVSEMGNPAGVISAGAGKLNAAAALAPAATLEPATISFGALQQASLPVSLALTITNTSQQPVTYNLAVNPTVADPKAQITVDPSILTLDPGASGTVSLVLAGEQPSPGLYEGSIAVQAEGVDLHAPYLYAVSDGVPSDIFPIVHGAFTGAPNDTDWKLAFRLVDQFGIPLANVPVEWMVVSGGGQIACSLPAGCADAATGTGGEAGALVTLGPDPGTQVFAAQAGDLTIEFTATVQ